MRPRYTKLAISRTDPFQGYTLRLAGVVSLLALGLPLASSAAPGQKLSGRHVPAALARSQPIRRLPATNQLRLAIGLPLRDPAGLQTLLAQLYDPASPNFRQYLTPEEFTARFAPMEQDLSGGKGFRKVEASYHNSVRQPACGKL